MSRPKVQAFLQEIKENPDDDTPRLILADWLQDHGDPRGEFVRCQVLAERLPKDDPQRRELTATADALAAEHAIDWLGPVANLLPAEAPTFFRFRRGLPSLTVDAARFFDRRYHELAEVEAYGWVDGVILRRLSKHQLARVAGFSLLMPLVDVCLYYASLVEELKAKLLGELCGLPRLRQLRLVGWHFPPAFWPERVTSTRLRALELAQGGLGDTALAGFLHLLEMTQVTTLGLWSGCSAQALAIIAQAPARHGLRRLGLCGWRLEMETARVLAESPVLQRLTELIVTAGSFSREALQLLRERFGDRFSVGNWLTADHAW